LLIVQDYCLLRKALADQLSREHGIEVCGHASGTEEVRKLVALHEPDLLLMNISLRTFGGFVRLRQFRREFPDLTVLTFSCDPEFEHLHAELAMNAGAAGYVSAADDEEILAHAIRQVMGGSVYLSERLRRCAEKTRREQSLYTGLSRREVEVFCLTGCGHVPKGIAEKLNLSIKTIESYRERIKEKMGLKDGAELLYAASSFMRRAAVRESFEQASEGLVETALLEATLRQAG
jgi:DNA-binding NarL/FixJ family response regulator